MNPYCRKTGEHVEREGTGWINAMTAELFIMTTLRIGAINVADGLAGEGAAMSKTKAALGAATSVAAVAAGAPGAALAPAREVAEVAEVAGVVA